MHIFKLIVLCTLSETLCVSSCLFMTPPPKNTQSALIGQVKHAWASVSSRLCGVFSFLSYLFTAAVNIGIRYANMWQCDVTKFQN